MSVACLRLSHLLVVVLLHSALSGSCPDSATAASIDTGHDALAADYTTLLSVKTAGSLQVAKKAGGLNDEATAVAPKADEQSEVPGVVFIKMIKVAGELFSSTLAQYAVKRGWRALQHKECSEAFNPLGQATCMCHMHYIGPEDVPTPPSNKDRYQALYTHMHYKPDLLEKYMVPGAVHLVILRHPLSVLRSTHAMAAYQAVHNKDVHNDFCQDLAHDGDAWRAKCTQVHSGKDSLLDYLDHDANERLGLLFVDRPKDMHEQAMSIVNEAEHLLENFFVGLQEDYDASMLLFERALKWSRGDSLYVDRDINSHSYHKSTATQAALDSWGIGTPRGEEIAKKLRDGPYFYHELLYKKGVDMHNKQMRAALGSKTDADSAIHTYRAQLAKFTMCMHKEAFRKSTGLIPNVCLRRGLERYAKARPQCANLAIAAELRDRGIE